jgi:hypothetical protein
MREMLHKPRAWLMPSTMASDARTNALAYVGVAPVPTLTQEQRAAEQKVGKSNPVRYRMEMNSLIYEPHVAWSLPLGNYEMVCTIEERRDGGRVVIVKENGVEIDHAEFPAPERGDFLDAMRASNHAQKLREKWYSRALQGMTAEFARLRP